jgi:hypothetical protein
MLEAGVTELPPHRSQEEFLAHRRFPEARNAMLKALLGTFEHDPFLNRLMIQAARGLMFIMILCLHMRQDEADRATWLTLKLVKESMAPFKVASPRGLADLVSRLIETGFLEQLSSPRDRRVRILRPTEKMFAVDQDWLIAHYAPMQVLFPDPGYAPIMQRDRRFQQIHRLVSASLFPLAAQIYARNPLMVQFLSREGGIMVLIKLLDRAGPNGHTTREISYSDIGAGFGISRTQVRKLLQQAETDGLVRFVHGRAISASTRVFDALSRRRPSDGRKGQFVQLTPKLIEAFDRYIADTMMGHDIVYELALRRAESM